MSGWKVLLGAAGGFMLLPILAIGVKGMMDYVAISNASGTTVLLLAAFTFVGAAIGAVAR